ncbi:hypothetical protein BAE44_0008741 [Dichanthelium oligosanthes]|uniref:Uncharacterized protein n=1 Tax=Dichanthelium oligosanthes TaxID=888268 RepID=A0A1E5VYP0_9POAL|nr:hypothetical protein BAE44_0008741 [Dichanthelium oligosanthes]
MRFRRGKSSNKAKKGNPAPWQNGEGKVVEGGGAGSNSRQVAPDTGFGNIDYGNVIFSSVSVLVCVDHRVFFVLAFLGIIFGSSKDETFFEATPWLESDCEDDFYSVNGDLTPARSFSSQTSRITPSGPNKNLPTLGDFLKAEPLKPPTTQRKLGDLLREAQDDGDSAVGGPDDLSRDDSLRLGQEANRCCVPQFARAISCNGRRRHK